MVTADVVMVMVACVGSSIPPSSTPFGFSYSVRISQTGNDDPVPRWRSFIPWAAEVARHWVWPGVGLHVKKVTPSPLSHAPILV